MALGISGIYALADPRTGAVRYIGKSVRIPQRYSEHCRGNLRGSGAWVRMLYGATQRRPRLVVLELCAREHLSERERWWIGAYRKSCGLLNLSNGGDGPGLGHIVASDTRAKLSAAHRRRGTRPPSRKGATMPREAVEKVRAALRGRPRPPEVRAKIGAAHRGKTLSPETRAKISAKLTGHDYVTPAVRAKMSAARRGHPVSPETRAKISAAQRGISVPARGRHK
jgi:NUMOD3 motif